jgi:hypothetical protein
MRKPDQKGFNPLVSTPEEHSMTPHTPEEFSTRLIDWSPFVIMGNTMPLRDPDEDEGEEDEEEEDRADEPPIMLEPEGPRVGWSRRSIAPPRACFGDSAALRRPEAGSATFFELGRAEVTCAFGISWLA